VVETKYLCDRCGSVIVEARTALAVESGPLRKSGLSSVDLCVDCAVSLVGWLRRDEPAEGRATPEPIAEFNASRP
jgi:hypothetical protein